MPAEPAQPLLERNALVTGASKGIGKGIAIALATAGANVAVNYHSDRTGAESTAEEIRKLGRRAVAVQADVGQCRDVDRMFSEIASEFSPLTIHINNAGRQTWKALLDLTEEEWDGVIATNLKGCFLCTQAAARHMVQQGCAGSIVNIGSGCNKVPFPHLVDYTASKGGIEMFTKVAAVELAAHKIRVNCVAPGAIETDFGGGRVRDNKELNAQIAGQTALGRVGLPDDIGGIVAFLCTEEARWINGQRIEASGGMFL